MSIRLHPFVVASVASVASILTAGCAKDDGAADATATPVNVNAGVPKNLPAEAPPVVGKQIQASQEAGQAMQSQAAKNGADYNAARSKAP